MYKTCLNNYLKITKEIRIKKKYLIIHNLHISLILHFVEGNSLRAKNYFKQVGLPIFFNQNIKNKRNISRNLCKSLNDIQNKNVFYKG